jgi:uncharacterized membrane protein
MIENPAPLITNDAVVLGILMTILGLIFITSSVRNLFQEIFEDSPIGFLCYFIPALFNTFKLYQERLQVYTTLPRYLLPASLVLLTLSINFAALKN